MEYISDFYQELISNLQNEISHPDQIIIVKPLGNSAIRQYIDAITNFWLLSVRAEDRNIYAKQIVRECALIYDSLINKFLSYSSTNLSFLETFKKGQKVIIEGPDKKKIDITNLLNDVVYFTRRIGLFFDCANIELSKIYADSSFPSHLKYKYVLDFTPYDKQNR